MSENREYYVTRGVEERLTSELKAIMWVMMEDMDGTPRGVIQMFQLSEHEGQQKIVHTQEVPEYRKKFIFPSERPVTETVFVIDDGKRLLMMLTEETQAGQQ